MSTPPPSSKTYHLSCHCQTNILRLEVPFPNPDPASTPATNSGEPEEGGKHAITSGDVCDCSHCVKRRIVWAFIPGKNVTLLKGFDTDKGDVKEYRFGSKRYGHQFCPKCGTYLLGSKWDPKGETVPYNLRAIRDPDFDLWKLTLKVYPGATREPAYVPVKLDDLPGAAEYLEPRKKEYSYDTEIQVGSCHCQAIKFAVLCKPLTVAGMNDCGCSICQGNGVIWLYPGRINTFFHPSASPSTPYTPAPGLLTRYSFGTGLNGHYLCSTCGVQIFEYRPRPVDDPRPPLPPGAPPREWAPENGSNGSFGLNVALFSGLKDEWLEDIHGFYKGIGEVDDEKKVLKRLFKEDDDRDTEPKYQLKLDGLPQSATTAVAA